MKTYKYLENEFMGKGSKNAVMNFLNLSEQDFVNKSKSLESTALGVVKSAINIDVIKEDEDGVTVLNSLCTSFVTAKLLEQTCENDYLSLSAEIMDGFKFTLRTISEAQSKSKISPDESKKKKFYGMKVF